MDSIHNIDIYKFRIIFEFDYVLYFPTTYFVVNIYNTLFYNTLCYFVASCLHSKKQGGSCLQETMDFRSEENSFLPNTLFISLICLGSV